MSGPRPATPPRPAPPPRRVPPPSPQTADYGSFTDVESFNYSSAERWPGDPAAVKKRIAPRQRSVSPGLARTASEGDLVAQARAQADWNKGVAESAPNNPEHTAEMAEIHEMRRQGDLLAPLFQSRGAPPPPPLPGLPPPDINKRLQTFNGVPVASEGRISNGRGLGPAPRRPAGGPPSRVVSRANQLQPGALADFSGIKSSLPVRPSSAPGRFYQRDLYQPGLESPTGISAEASSDAGSGSSGPAPGSSVSQQGKGVEAGTQTSPRLRRKISPEQQQLIGLYDQYRNALREGGDWAGLKAQVEALPEGVSFSRKDKIDVSKEILLRAINKRMPGQKTLATRSAEMAVGGPFVDQVESLRKGNQGLDERASTQVYEGPDGFVGFARGERRPSPSVASAQESSPDPIGGFVADSRGYKLGQGSPYTQDPHSDYGIGGARPAGPGRTQRRFDPNAGTFGDAPMPWATSEPRGSSPQDINDAKALGLARAYQEAQRQRKEAAERLKSLRAEQQK